MSVVEHVVEMAMPMMHLDAEMMPSGANMMANVKPAGEGVWSADERQRDSGNDGELHGLESFVLGVIGGDQ